MNSLSSLGHDLPVSILVPTYNRRHYIGECLDSLLKQTVSPLEIIVIDDGSTDGTADYLASHYSGRIRYVRKENGGKSSALNLGMSMVKGDIVWIFDDDDVALPEAIENRLIVFAVDEQTGIVYSPHYYGADDDKGRIDRKRLAEVCQYLPDRFMAELMKGCFFSLNSALVRKECYEQVGPFDESLFSSEDYDMLLRLGRRNPIAFSPQPSFIVREHSGARGAGHIRYNGAQRKEVFRKFDQVVGRKLRGNLTLPEYLIPPRKAFVGSDQIVEALLSRAIVMASKGCIAEMFEDFEAAVRETESLDLKPGSINSKISEAICTGYACDACLADWSVCVQGISGLKKFRLGRQAVLALAEGFYRLAKGYPGNLSERLARLQAAFRVLGQRVLG